MCRPFCLRAAAARGTTTPIGYILRFVRSVSIAVVVISALFSTVRVSYAQENEEEQGHSIGKVSVLGDLIVIELNEDALGKSNLFDLTGRTLRFIPEGLGYRIENRALRWDSDYGPELPGTEVRLRKF